MLYLCSENREKIDVMSRVQLTIDVREFYELGFLSINPLLGSIRGLKYETEYAVLRYGFINIERLYYDLMNTKYFDQFQVTKKTTIIVVQNNSINVLLFFQKNLWRTLKSLYWKNSIYEKEKDSDQTHELKVALIRKWMSRLGNSQYTSEMIDAVEKWVINPDENL